MRCARSRDSRTWLARCIVMALVFAPTHQLWCDSIVNSPHNLSMMGPGPVKSTTEEELCIFCHTPHKARSNAPLWNREDSSAVYLTYQSSTLDVTVGQPTGSSVLCLSCHDGTIALGAVVSRSMEIPFDPTHRFMSGRANLGSDLRNDHPISFSYSSAANSDDELIPTGSLSPSVHLDANGDLQCTSCHDPHDNANGNFLLQSNEFSMLCLSCHQPNSWVGSAHQSSTATWTGAGDDPWPFTTFETVAQNGCQNCHVVHEAGSDSLLLRSNMEEENCLVCHSGTVAEHDIATEIAKTFTHPVQDFTGVHQPEEDALSMARHVECTDCHNPHRVREGSGTAPAVPANMEGVPGVNLSGTQVSEATFAYEICLKCHGDTAEATSPTTRLVDNGNNLRLDIATSNASFHPIAGPRNNPDVPSLIAGFNSSSVIYCHDCHGNPDGERFGGGGPDGPHGSNFPFLLRARYETADFTEESASAYALCYQCHDRESILDDESFEHDEHVDNEDTPCSVCHDPHGVDTTGANPDEHRALINFDLSVVQPDPNTGLLRYERTGQFRGRCYLRCHGENHSPESYPDD